MSYLSTNDSRSREIRFTERISWVNATSEYGPTQSLPSHLVGIISLIGVLSLIIAGNQSHHKYTQP
jgi:hypothetical protein